METTYNTYCYCYGSLAGITRNSSEAWNVYGQTFGERGQLYNTWIEATFDEEKQARQKCEELLASLRAAAREEERRQQEHLDRVWI